LEWDQQQLELKIEYQRPEKNQDVCHGEFIFFGAFNVALLSWDTGVALLMANVSLRSPPHKPSKKTKNKTKKSSNNITVSLAHARHISDVSATTHSGHILVWSFKHLEFQTPGAQSWRFATSLKQCDKRV
jgi:hypothetical protein